jgi:hypothetical protein
MILRFLRDASKTDSSSLYGLLPTEVIMIMTQPDRF